MRQGEPLLMRRSIKLAGGLAAGTLLLLGCASVAFAADPLTGAVTVGANTPTTSGGETNGTATVSLGSSPTTSGGTTSDNATVSLGSTPTAESGETNGTASVS